jgi:hypothetical protein
MSAQEFLSNKLFQLIEVGELSNLTKLLTENNIDVTQYYDNSSSSLLIKAIFVNQTQISLLLLNIAIKAYHKDQILNWLERKNDSGFNALHYASFRGNIKIMEKLIELGSDINVTNKNGLNIMHIAAQGNQATSIGFLREILHLDVSSHDAVNSTPLHWASYMNAEYAFNYLIYFGADINAKDIDGSTPLHLAVMNGNTF